MEGLAISPLMVFLILLVLYVISSIQILNEYERAVVFRLGKLLPQPKGPGVVLVFRPIDRYVRISLRTVVLDEQPAPGGQIYRGLERVARDHPQRLAVLGEDYAAGLSLVRAFRACQAEYRPATTVWQVELGPQPFWTVRQTW